MVFNGLKGAELVVYNWLATADKRVKISICDVADFTGYHPNTVRRAMHSLDKKQYIERRRKRRGQRYEYRIVR